MQPPSNSWWWFENTEQDPIDRIDRVWRVVAIVLLTISFGQVVDMSTRLSGGPDILSAYAVIIQSVLTMLAAGGILTNSGKKAFEYILKRKNIPKGLWGIIGFGLASFFLIIILFFTPHFL